MTISLFLYTKARIISSVQYLTYTLYSFQNNEMIFFEQPTTSAALGLERGAQIRWVRDKWTVGSCLLKLSPFRN